jgi:hypothetical protein
MRSGHLHGTLKVNTQYRGGLRHARCSRHKGSPEFFGKQSSALFDGIEKRVENSVNNPGRQGTPVLDVR